MESTPPTAQTIDFALSTPHPRGEALRLIAGFCVALTFLVAMPDAPSRVVGFGAAVAAFGAWMWDRLVRMQRRLRFGADGIHIRSKSDALRFVPWEHVVGLTRGPSRQLYLKTQYEELLIGTDFGVSEEPMGPVIEQRPLWAPGLKADARMADLIESARAHCVPGDSRCEAVLNGKERADWTRVLEEALTKGDYRGRSLTRADLLHDLANPSLSPELRTCIASAIRPRFDEAERLRETLSATAAPRVRVALEKPMHPIKEGSRDSHSPQGSDAPPESRASTCSVPSPSPRIAPATPAQQELGIWCSRPHGYISQQIPRRRSTSSRPSAGR